VSRVDVVVFFFFLELVLLMWLVGAAVALGCRHILSRLKGVVSTLQHPFGKLTHDGSCLDV